MDKALRASLVIGLVLVGIMAYAQVGEGPFSVSPPPTGLTGATGATGAYAPAAYASLFLNSPEASLQMNMPIGGDYYPIPDGGFTVGVQDSNGNVVASAQYGGFTIGANGEGDYEVAGTLTFMAIAHQELHWTMTKGDSTTLRETKSGTAINNDLNYSSLSITGMVHLMPGDRIRPRARYEAGQDDAIMTLTHGNISLIRRSP